MRQLEAEQEAARRNAEDERRDRFVFYALDHSAGMGDDAWEVEMRLRTPDDGPTPAPLTVAARAAAVVPSEPDPAPEPLATPQTFDAIEDVEPEPEFEALEPVAPAVRATEPDLEPRMRRPRRLRVIHVWAAIVVLVGLLFIGATLLLAVGLRDYTHFGVLPTTVGIALGLVAVWIGVALART
jgi:hypothetical protein